ncbi:MAG: hypothetical protein SGILL_008553, partial [Bacillariaceae sp.]
RDLDLRNIAWLSHGRSFKVLDIASFSQHTLPKFFPKIQYKSFIRQLNIYAFSRVKDRKSPAFGEYSHRLFVRGNPDLCTLMTRQKVKGTGVPRNTFKQRTLHHPSTILPFVTIPPGSISFTNASQAPGQAPGDSLPTVSEAIDSSRNDGQLPIALASNVSDVMFQSTIKEVPEFFTPQNVFGIDFPVKTQAPA